MRSAVDRVFDILEALAEAPEGLPLAHVARRAGLAKATAHRLLAELAARGVVRAADGPGGYRLTLELAVLGTRHLAGLGVLDLAQPELDRLAAVSGELARLAWLDGERLVLIAEAQGAAPGLRYDANLGRIAKLHATAVGKCWLADLSAEEARARVAAQGLIGAAAGLGPAAITSFEGLATELARVRRAGFATAVDEGELGAAAVAAPIRTEGKAPRYLGSLAVIGPTVRLSRARLAALAPEVIAGAGRLGRLLTLAPWCRRIERDPRRLAAPAEA
jgi:IclR family acetate operon transcriptional repressor